MDIQSSYTASFKFYSKSIIVIIFVFFILLEVYLRLFIVNIPRTTPKLIYDIYTKSADTVAIGDSQIFRAFISQSEILNLGRRGMPIPAVRIALNNYIKENSPKKVMIQASPQLFSQPQLDRGDEKFSNYFNLINSPVKIYIFEKGITQYINRINGFNDFIKTITEPEIDRLLDYQYHWSKIDFKTKRKSAAARVEHHKPIMSSQTSLYFQKEYDELIRTLIRRNISLCMIEPPVAELYNLESNKHNGYSLSKKFFNNISKKYDIKYIKNNDLNVLFLDKMFINQDHLNEDGSKLYSTEIFKACFEGL